MPRYTRREFARLAGAGLTAAIGAPPTVLRYPSSRPIPSASQLRWQADELAMFLHFGVNTFTDREWGDGGEDPVIFNPAALDARQWARTARRAGFRALILTAKHHDGFCLWPSTVTNHTVANSPFRGGQGDVVREFVDACRAERLRPGLYLSPWDRHEPSYGDSPKYNDFYVAQLTELLTRYGRLAEVWFDGANGEGPNGKRQLYDWPRFFRTVRRLQPDAVMFSDAGPDVRWIGNENGVAGDPNWSTVDPAAVPYPGATGPGITEMLQHGDPHGSVWRPGETDVSIRPGWFYHASENDQVKSLDALTEIYFSSVGHNSKLLLNIPPTRAGLLHQTDVSRVVAFGDRIAGLYGRDLAGRADESWRVTGAHTAFAEWRIHGAVTADVIALAEDIARGQGVTSYTLEGRQRGVWQELSRGATIGYRKLDRFEPATLDRVRITLDYVGDAAPIPIRMHLYRRDW